MVRDLVYLEKIHNKKVFCFLSEPIPSQKKIVIMSHGFRGSLIGPARTFVDFSRILVRNGFSVLRFDQPNSGNSDGDFLNVSFNNCVEAIVYFAKKFIDNGYKIALLGQSMGATATVVASSKPKLQGKIACLLLWVPGPVLTFNRPANKIFEEEGQKYKGEFWREAQRANSLASLKKFKGGTHLVYGEYDRYVSKEERDKVIVEVKRKGQKVMILEGQNHSSWEYEITQNVYREELKELQECFIK